MRFVINTGIKAQFVDNVIALGLATGNAHHSKTSRFGQCTISTAHRTAGSTDSHSGTGFGLNDFVQTIPSCDTGHTYCAKVMAHRNFFSVDVLECARHICIDQAVCLPAAHALDSLTHFELCIFTFSNFAHSAANHGFTQRLRLCIIFTCIHATAHVRVEAEVMVFNQDLSVL